PAGREEPVGSLSLVAPSPRPPPSSSWYPRSSGCKGEVTVRATLTRCAPEPLGLPTSSLREADEQVTQVGGARRPAQQRAHAEDFLDRPQRRAVVVADGVRVPAALGLERERHHADRTVAALALVPEDEERAVVEVGLAGED